MYVYIYIYIYDRVWSMNLFYEKCGFGTIEPIIRQIPAEEWKKFSISKHVLHLSGNQT